MLTQHDSAGGSFGHGCLVAFLEEFAFGLLYRIRVKLVQRSFSRVLEKVQSTLKRLQGATITPKNFLDDGWYRLILVRFFVIFREMGVIGVICAPK